MKSKKTLHREKQIKANIFKKSKTAQRKEDLTNTSVDGKKKKRKEPSKQKIQQNGDREPERNIKAADMLDMMRDSSDDEEPSSNLPKRPRLDSVSDASN